MPPLDFTAPDGSPQQENARYNLGEPDDEAKVIGEDPSPEDDQELLLGAAEEETKQLPSEDPAEERKANELESAQYPNRPGA